MTSCTYDDVISLMKSWLWWSRVRVARGAWNIACWTILGREQFIWVPSVVPITYSVGSHFGGLGCHHNSPLLLHQLFTYTVYPPTPAHSSLHHPPPSSTYSILILHLLVHKFINILIGDHALYAMCLILRLPTLPPSLLELSVLVPLLYSFYPLSFSSLFSNSYPLIYPYSLYCTYLLTLLRYLS